MKTSRTIGACLATSVLTVATALAVSCVPEPAHAQEMTPQKRERMCAALQMMAAEGDSYARGVWTRHCRKPAAPVRVEVDALTVARASNCPALRQKADAGDPVATYDWVKAREAGLCK